MRRLLPVLAAMLALTAPAGAATPESWPPQHGPGVLFVHFGEEHWNDDDGLTLLPKVVADTARYKPALVTMSGDKANDGNTDELGRWLEIMGAYDKAGVPWLAGVGNHDRKAPPGVPGGIAPTADLANYEKVFAPRPYPMGDGTPYRDPGFAPRERPAGEPEGASSHYSVDVGNARWIFIDNSCWGIVNCDPLQSPSFPDAEGFDSQYDFLRARATEARDRGMRAFVVMHMPTRDPRDQSYADPTSAMHTMGKGGSPDNSDFETLVADTGVDGVFLAHIKGQFLYKGRGEVPYYIDGGAGGELYTTGPVGVDHGYWHGYRLVRVDGTRIITDAVPIFVDNGITVTGPATLTSGSKGTWEAFGRQPVFNDPAKVEALELRDPNPTARSGGASGVLSAAPWTAPLLLLLTAPLFGRLMTRPPLRRFAPAPVALGGAVALLPVLAVVSLAQQSEPTSTPKESLPVPARIWTSSNPLVLAPVAAADDDPRRDTRTQTDSGTFTAGCPGRARLTITSGWESHTTAVTVPSGRGRIARRVAFTRRSVRRGRAATLARVLLAQRAELLARLKRGKRTVVALRHACLPAGRSVVRWSGRNARRGRYTLELRVRSDRRTLVRRRVLVVR